MGEAQQDGPLLRQFASPDAFNDLVLAESSILGFRNLLGKHQLAVAISTGVNAVLSEKMLSTKRGRGLDADNGRIHALACTTPGSRATRWWTDASIGKTSAFGGRGITR